MPGKRNSCEGCKYWRRLSWSGGGKRACHYLLETCRRRQRDSKGRCINFTKTLDIPKKGDTLEV